MSARISLSADLPSIEFDRGPDASTLLTEAQKRAGLAMPKAIHPILELDPSPEGFFGRGIPTSILEGLAVDLPGNPTAPCEGTQRPEDDGKGAAALSRCSKTDEAPSCLAGVEIADLLPTSLRNLRIPDFSPVTGPYAPLVEDSAAFKEALALKRQLEGLGKGLDPVVRDRVLRDFPPIDSARSALLSEARPLDTDDEKLDADRVRLLVWRRRLETRSAAMNDLLAKYNQECRTRELPPADVRTCNNWADRFNSCVDRHNASAGRFNAALSLWRQNRARLQSRGDAFRAKARDWENLQVVPWNARAKKALDGGCDRLLAITLLPSPAIVPTGGKPLIFRAYPDFEGRDNPCPVSYLWQASGGIGTLVVDSADQLRATLTSSDVEAEGSVEIEGVDTTGKKERASAQVLVKNTVQKCELTNHSCRNLETDVQNWCSYLCCGDEVQLVRREPTCDPGHCPTQYCVPK